jgi:hypothetical protein
VRKRKKSSRKALKARRPVAAKKLRTAKKKVCSVHYRICDEKSGLPHTLFHGIRGSRKIPLGRWVKARVATVHDGDRGRPYKSGFHVLKDRKTAKRVLLDTFKKLKGRVVVKVNVADVWPKRHSKHGVVLARWMRLSKDAWKKREKIRKGAA